MSSLPDADALVSIPTPEDFWASELTDFRTF
jgi:hypothetical protein